MGLLDVLGQFLHIFVDLLPRFCRRPLSTEWLVVDSFLFGPHIPWRRPVLHIPIMDEAEHWPKTERAISSSVQGCTTADDVQINVDTACSFRIENPLTVRKAWSDDYEVQIGMRLRGAVEAAHSDCKWEDVTRSDHSWIVQDLADELSEMDIELTYFCVEERVVSPSFRVFGIG